MVRTKDKEDCMFRKWIAGALTALLAGPALAADGEKVQVKGEIIDTWCYFSGVMGAPESVVGSAHHTCAIWCAAGGIPVSIKDEDENHYVVLKVEGEDTNVAAPSILRIQAHQVTVEGDLIERDGVKYLLVSQVANDDGIVNLSHEDVGIQPFGK